ncbi:DNA-binding XRE family transcriptional regulator [Rhodococcus sp. 27YEA15]|uniref:helix-turn-helix domain-containing protein n=1 Tax=Rhodococcus sp. 27YEA15 TaxID=3156259 RepID=UPI003C7D1D2F
MVNRAKTPRTLAQLRASAQLTQAEVAHTLGISQDAVVKLERASNPRISTILGYVAALGGSATVTIDLGDHHHTLLLPTATLPVTPDVEAWCVRGRNDRGHESLCMNHGIIAISNGDEFDESMNRRRTDAELRRLTESRYPDRSPRGISVFVGYVRAFGEAMSIGDVVVMPLSGHRDSAGTQVVTMAGRRRVVSGYNVAIGRVTGDYEFVLDSDPLRCHRRTVAWSAVVAADSVPVDIRSAVNAPGTIHKIAATGAAERLLELADTYSPR